VNGLAFTLLDSANVIGVDINNAQANQHLDMLASGIGADKIDIVISNHVTDELTRYFALEQILEIPTLHFGGFHPDVIYFAKQVQPEQPQFYLNNPTVSAIGSR